MPRCQSSAWTRLRDPQPDAEAGVVVRVQGAVLVCSHVAIDAERVPSSLRSSGAATPQMTSRIVEPSSSAGGRVRVVRRMQMQLLTDGRLEHRALVLGLTLLESEVTEEPDALLDVLDAVVQFLYAADTHAISPSDSQAT